MKREEAIKIIKGLVGTLEFSASQEDALIVAIKALQGDMYCPNCGARLVPEDEYLEPTQTHGRLIDAYELMRQWNDYLEMAVGNFPITPADITQIINDAPTVQAYRPHGEWVEHKWAEEFDGLLISNYECTNCHSWERNNTDFCPNCGAYMKGENK